MLERKEERLVNKVQALEAHIETLQSELATERATNMQLSEKLRATEATLETRTDECETLSRAFTISKVSVHLLLAQPSVLRRVAPPRPVLPYPAPPCPAPPVGPVPVPLPPPMPVPVHLSILASIRAYRARSRNCVLNSRASSSWGSRHG